ncbi:unnamed protein product [Rotaria sp. Silwood2]|nr:unnamed protein product [Rotaria sp. Silwood2]CAF4401730.1 unnamed protein product [Rotaria sp. Silwood2]CAF4453346.1 unnamed protein product [Rotaria sp. Silwood2]CAF4483148.1 unnamed protein product [Rotaria sp. Silwood2]
MLMSTVVVIVLFSFNGILQAAKCPNIATVSGFNANRYAGVWYEVYRNTILFELGAKCVNATYTVQDDGSIGVFNQAINSFGYYTSINGTAKVKNSAQPGSLVVNFNSPSIKQNLTANYHPQSNMTERVNRTLKPLIAIYAQQHHSSWDIEIQKLAFAIRTAINETTGETPAFLMFGRDPRDPLDLLIGETIEESSSMVVNHESIQEYKNKLINNFRSAFNVIREHSEIEKIRQKEKYDQHTTQKQHKEGDLVWIANLKPQIGENCMVGKLQPHYEGPYRLIK